MLVADGFFVSRRSGDWDINDPRSLSADTLLVNIDGGTIITRNANQIGSGIFYTYLYTSPGWFVPYFQLIKWVNTEDGRKRCVVEWEGKDTIWAIDLKPNFISDDLYGLDVPVEFENTTVVQPSSLIADSTYWNYGNGISQWIYNTETESHNGYATYDMEGKYRITLTEYYKLCNRTTSREIEIKEDVGIVNVNNINSNIIIYPNPASTQLHVEMDHNPSLQTKYVIYNIIGQIVMQGKLQESAIINVESLAKGMYYLRISGVTLKFVKN